MSLEQEAIDYWKSVPKKDIEAIRKFFDDYKYLNISDLSTLLGIPIVTLANYRRRAKLTVQPKRNQVNPIFTSPPELEQDVDPYVDTKEWWEKHYARFGYVKLAQIVGYRDHNSVVDKLKKHNIPLRGHRSLAKTHRRNNYAWLHKYYVVCGFGLKRLARMAGGVSHNTIKSWLVKHRIPKRNNFLIYVGENSSEQNDKSK